jgi:hypothetical protein
MKGAQVQLELQTLAWQNWRQGQAAIRLAKMQPEWEAGDELIIAKTHFAQEWAIAEKERKGKAPVTVKDLGIPTEYVMTHSGVTRLRAEMGRGTR